MDTQRPQGLGPGTERGGVYGIGVWGLFGSAVVPMSAGKTRCGYNTQHGHKTQYGHKTQRFGFGCKNAPTVYFSLNFCSRRMGKKHRLDSQQPFFGGGGLG